MKVVLVKSKKIKSPSEVRLSKKARSRLNTKLFKPFRLGNVSAEVHQAYKEDLRSVRRKLTPEQKSRTVFASKALFELLGLDEPLIEIDINKLKKYVKLLEKPEVILLGSDPEFALMDNGHLIQAFRALSEKIRNAALGWDDSLIQAEIRPEPSDDPIEVANSLRHILETNIDILSEFEPTAIASIEGRFFGGHVHIDLPKLHTEDVSKLCDLLENVLNSTVLPFLVPFEPNSERRLQYVHKNWRLKENPTKKILEWRFPSSEIIIHPEVFISTLELTKTVVEKVLDIIENNDAIEIERDMEKLKLNKVDISRITNKTRESALKWIDELCGNCGERLIDLSNYMIKNKKEVKLNRNILKTWLKEENLFI